MEKKRILCYGDSNTWGHIPRWTESIYPGSRYDENTRWPCVAAKYLGDDYCVIEDGLDGRTTMYDVPGEEYTNGKRFIGASLTSNRPIDLVAVMLGTNDLHLPYPLKEEQLGDGITAVIETILNMPRCGRGYVPPKVLVMAPIEVKPSAPNGRVLVYHKFFDDWGRNLSLKFPEVYEKAAKEHGCYFLNAALYAQPSDADGVHFMPESHRRLGEAVAKKIKEIFEHEQAAL